MKKIIIYGAGGFGREIACLINSINTVAKEWNLIGFIDDGIKAGESNAFGKILGNIDYINSYKEKVALVIPIASPKILRHIIGKLTNPNIWYPNLISPDVKFHDRGSFKCGKGNIVFSSCRISCSVEIGDFNIMNSLVSLGHDVRLGNRNVLNPGARISGDCKIGNDNFFGVYAVALQGLKIGEETRVGASSVVMRNTRDKSVYLGNPAKLIRFS